MRNIISKIKYKIENSIFKLLEPSFDRYISSYKKINVLNKNNISRSSIIKKADISGDISIGDKSKIVNGVILSGNIEIGKYSTINGPGTDIFAHVNKVKIGNFCSIARNVAIQEYNHPYMKISNYLMSRNVFETGYNKDLTSKGPIIIENDVWIGTQCVILSGVTIGNGAIIAANSVVSKNIPPYAIAAGSPAKVIKYRFSNEIIKKLLQIQWWNWDIDKIKYHQNLFSDEISIDILNKIMNS